MRQVKEYVAKDGAVTYRVRYRSGNKQHSETFRRRPDAETFAQLLDISTLDALRWLHDRQGNRPEDATTFGQWFDTYLAQLTGITPRTRDDYAAMHRRYLTELDPLPLSLITRAHVAGIVNELDRAGKSPKTIKNVIHMLSSIMALAVDEGHIPRNPTKRVRLPKQELDGHEERYLTHEEAGALIEATPDYYRPLVIFLIGSGVRWSEATALQGRDVDLVNGTIRIRRAWKRVPGGWEVGPPKSVKANRTINPSVAALLAVQPLIRKPNDLVFTTPAGNVIRHANFYNRVWLPACKRAGLDPRPKIHDCRHTFASFLISEGQPLEAVGAQLGHEHGQTTQRYAKLMPAVGVAAGRSASAAMERVLAARREIADVRTRALESAADADHTA